MGVQEMLIWSVGCRPIREQKIVRWKERSWWSETETDETDHGKAVFFSNNKVHGMTMSNKCLLYYGGQSHWQREGQGAGKPGYWKDSPHIHEVTKNYDRNHIREWQWARTSIN